MNATWALARIRIDEAEKAARAGSDWHTAYAYGVKREQDARDAARRAALARMREFYEARYQSKLAAAAQVAARTATSGVGWRVIESPKVSHLELETFVRSLWDLAFHAVPWPTGWKARWADLRAANANGMCVHASKLILLDPAAQRGRSHREFITTIVHELSHLQHPGEVHGPGHAETLRRLVDFVLGEPDAVGAGAPHSEPVKGRRFDGRPVAWAGADQWEFR